MVAYYLRHLESPGRKKYFRVRSREVFTPRTTEPDSLPLERGGSLSSKLGNWMIGAGMLFLAVSLVCALAGLSSETDRNNVLLLAGCAFSMGALMSAGGLYIKARFYRSQAPQGEEAEPPRRVRGGCDLCAGDAPVICCKVHQLHLCPACLAEHYDFRSCAYVPSTRKPAARVRAMAKARGV